MKKINQLLLLTLTLFFGFIIWGCRKGNNPQISTMCFDIFYKIEEDKVKNNKVIVALGNRLYDEDGTMIFDPASKEYDDFKVTVYVDNMMDYAEKIKITREDFFSYEYQLQIPRTITNPTSVSDYNKTYEFNLSDYNISSFIKFSISYSSNNKPIVLLDLYGKTVGSTFIVEDSRLVRNSIIETHLDIFYEIEEDKVKDNKVIAALGNRIYVEGDKKYLEDYYDFVITMYVDNMEEYTEQIKISREEFFSDKYRLLIPNDKYQPTAASDYNKTYEFNLRNYNISKHIIFIVSYTVWLDELSEYSLILDLYGKTVGSTFIVEDHKLSEEFLL